MGALTKLIPVVMLVAATPARADGVDRWHPMIDEASIRFGVPTRWIERVMRAESRGLTTLNGQPIRSRAGAIGLMQLMPSTWAEMRARLGLGTDPDDPRDNILAGTFYLRLMYDRFGYPGLFGAYNAGPGAYTAYLGGKRRLPSETLAYLASITGTTSPRPLAMPSPTSPPLFVIRRAGPVEQSATAVGQGEVSTFIIRKVIP